MTSALISTLAFTHQTNSGADVKFVRQYKGVNYTIYAGWSSSHSTWFQWGAPKQVIIENAPVARAFFASKITFNFMGSHNERHNKAN